MSIDNAAHEINYVELTFLKRLQLAWQLFIRHGLKSCLLLSILLLLLFFLSELVLKIFAVYGSASFGPKYILQFLFEAVSFIIIICFARLFIAWAKNEKIGMLAALTAPLKIFTKLIVLVMAWMLFRTALLWVGPLFLLGHDILLLLYFLFHVLIVNQVILYAVYFLAQGQWLNYSSAILIPFNGILSNMGLWLGNFFIGIILALPCIYLGSLLTTRLLSAQNDFNDIILVYASIFVLSLPFILFYVYFSIVNFLTCQARLAQKNLHY